MRKTLSIAVAAVAAVATVAYLAVALPYAARRHSSVVCNRMAVVVADSDVNRLVRKEDIPAIFRAGGQTYFGKRLGEISTQQLEQALRERSLIREANVFTTVDGVLHVHILQRRPIVRVYAEDGQSFYIDSEGFILQPYGGYTSDVPIASGHITSPFPKRYKGSMFQHFSGGGKSDSLLLQLFAFARHLSGSPFWQAQVEQIYVTPQGRVELVPRVGAHVIRMGTLDGFEHKLRKLYTLYQKGLPLKGWNTYDMIDVSYGNQVVCRKKADSNKTI
ncbi:MAG: hypothetical protein LBS63_02450 [Prevotellaceae bacterium]|jgi:cell division protein FtsQ|nr:hypothetical protein [Prevotellaceae bacterium]